MASRLRGLAYATALVWISAYICRNWFYHPTAHMNSLYGYWAALAKYGAWSWPPAWWPFHDFGSPIEFLSAPLVPAIASASASITGLPHLMAVQAVSAIFYCAAPVALFLTAWRLTRAPGASFLAAIGYVLLSPAQILAPDGDFRWARIFEPHRFMLQAIWDETPRSALLTFLLLFLLLFARWLESRRPLSFVLACAALALAILASPFAAISAALALLALLTARRTRRALRRIADHSLGRPHARIERHTTHRSSRDFLSPLQPGGPESKLSHDSVLCSMEWRPYTRHTMRSTFTRWGGPALSCNT